jgi:hypothetical protein
MILASHAVIGAALASFLPTHPVAAAVLAFASHFAIDAVPHWDYPIRSPCVHPGTAAAMRYDRRLLRDLVVIGIDGMAGTVLALALFASSSTIWVILLGAFAAMLPDPLQFLYGRFPREPLRSLQRFHVWIHSNRRLDDRVVLGVVSQFAFISAAAALALYAHRAFVLP